MFFFLFYVTGKRKNALYGVWIVRCMLFAGWCVFVSFDLELILKSWFTLLRRYLLFMGGVRVWRVPKWHFALSNSRKIESTTTFHFSLVKIFLNLLLYLNTFNSILKQHRIFPNSDIVILVKSSQKLILA